MRGTAQGPGSPGAGDCPASQEKDTSISGVPIWQLAACPVASNITFQHGENLSFVPRFNYKPSMKRAVQNLETWVRFFLFFSARKCSPVSGGEHRVCTQCRHGSPDVPETRPPEDTSHPESPRAAEHRGPHFPCSPSILQEDVRKTPDPRRLWDQEPGCPGSLPTH